MTGGTVGPAGGAAAACCDDFVLRGRLASVLVASFSQGMHGENFTNDEQHTEIRLSLHGDRLNLPACLRSPSGSLTLALSVCLTIPPAQTPASAWWDRRSARPALQSRTAPPLRRLDPSCLSNPSARRAQRAPNPPRPSRPHMQRPSPRRHQLPQLPRPPRRKHPPRPRHLARRSVRRRRRTRRTTKRSSR